VRWVLETGTLVALLQLMASIQDRIQREHEQQTGELCPRPPAWWALLAVLVLARRGWAPLARSRSKRNHAILSRERFRCAAGGCSRRRGLEDHHLHYRGRGGSNRRHNRACLCAFHHRLGEHGGILRVRGKAIPDARALRWQLALDPQGRPTRVIRGDEILYDAGKQRPRAGYGGDPSGGGGGNPGDCRNHGDCGNPGGCSDCDDPGDCGDRGDCGQLAIKTYIC
jgi:hypothetical protein